MRPKDSFRPTPPLGLPEVPLPPDNPLTPARIELGRKLFLDRRLSHNGTLSCAMCHVPEQGFTSNELATPIGLEGRSLRRNAPTLYNVAYAMRLFHDGRETSLENQVWSPLLARNEMGNPSVGYVIEKIQTLSDYKGLFEQAFGRGPDMLTVGQALAAYQRTLLSANAPFDRWYYGKEAGALSREAQRGFEVFRGKAGCTACHLVGEKYALFTDNAFHNTGVGWARSMGVRGKRSVRLAPGLTVEVDEKMLQDFEPPIPDTGRFEVTFDPRDRWAYRTPTLRNVALTAPYMHDGSLATLEEVVAFYDRGGFDHPLRDPRLKPLGLTAEEQQALVAFLKALTGDNVERLAREARAAP
ncbi:cytochrome-c peroxidase [Pelomicrobium sp.]|jgi:cytochrome c peroxidase|uniref:cytochrome-c peroxidase n=1 Tax=Pelomicrobium sp. TaxID=2815319 RepID=UPI002FDDF160